MNLAYWATRVFHNSFTYRGQRRRVRGWSVKIQYRGVRRTLALRATDGAAAAEEALALYSRVTMEGWECLDRARGSESGAGRLAPRKYTVGLTPGLEQELFVPLSHAGETHHVGLGTEQPNAAALRAAEIETALLRDGWEHVKLRFPWEFTVAVFWSANPMVCTYTTLVTIPAGGVVPKAPAPTGKGWRVHVFEPDGGVRRAMTRWLAASPGVVEVRGLGSADEVRGAASLAIPDLVLINQSLPPATFRSLREHWKSRHPWVRILDHGIFRDSDEIFFSVSGVTGGYFLRRVGRTGLLDPVVRAFPSGPPSAEEADRQTRRYFQQLLEAGPVRQDDGGPDITAREAQILELLRRGLVDKEIGRELRISVWTVHSHLKRIFAKLGVRRRAEAVARHIYK
ncbi:MAG: response regulator transcription factor [Verrucomicrobiales bacterium]|nr:response regulator transcription factor [Verrucomicrobiales bacterium]